MYKSQEEWEKLLRDKIISEKINIKLFEIMEMELYEADVKNLSAVFRFPLKEWYKNQFEAIGGAIISSFMEMACGTMANALCMDKEAVVTDLNIAYIRNLRYKEDILVRVKLVKEGKMMIRTHGEIYDGKDGKLAITAECSSFRL